MRPVRVKTKNQTDIEKIEPNLVWFLLVIFQLKFCYS